MSNKIDFDMFDPNGSSSAVSVWGVWDGYSFTVKPARGGQLTRVRNARRAKLWELTTSGWELRAVKDPEKHDDNCDLCGQPGLRDLWKNSGRFHNHHAKGYVWKRDGGKITSPPELLLLCPECKSATDWY